MWNRLNLSMMLCQMIFGFSFYGVMIILTPFFLENLNYSEADTMLVVGAFSALGPLFSIAGGFIADKVLGGYRSVLLSFIGFSIGYALLFVGATRSDVLLSLLGIAMASYARGLFSPSYPTLYKQTFDTQEHFENAYTINYSVNNAGALIGQYIYPFLVLYLGFSGNFILSGIMTAAAVILLFIIHRPLVAVANPIDQTRVSPQRWLAFMLISAAMIAVVFFMFSEMETFGKKIIALGGIAAFSYFIYLMTQASRNERLRMGTILIIASLAAVFYIYYGQMMTSMTIVSINTMRGDLFGLIPIEPEGSMVMNPLWCMVAGPVLAWIFSILKKKNIELSTATKLGFSFILTATAFSILTFANKNIGPDVIIRPEVFLVIHFFQAFAEVIMGSLAIAFILSVAPKMIENFSVSLFWIVMALSGMLSAFFSTNIALEKGQTLTQELAQNLYGDYFFILAALAVVMSLLAFGASFAIRALLAKQS